ncbi:MAG: DUF971 domain-containing protein [Balneolaceae bacterium]|nr:DUF971 domain-containing protein [Balneolaceae bacterium]
MEKRFIPVSVDVGNSEQTLTLGWADGHQSKFSLFGLRKNCPCVSCRGGHDMMGLFEPQLFLVEPTQTFKIISAESIGNHALKITWDDGHNAGMYRWDLLRHMDESVRNLEQTSN